MQTEVKWLHSPLPDPHRERVDILVQLVEECDALDDHVVGLVHVELDLGAAVAVRQTQLGLVRGNWKKLDLSLEKIGTYYFSFLFDVIFRSLWTKKIIYRPFFLMPAPKMKN